MTKMKNIALNVIKTIFVLAVLSFMIVAGIFIWNLIVKEPAIDDPIVNDPTVQQTFEFSVNEFTLFEIEEFGFDFILADIHVKSNKPINISLSHFTTSENIQLNSVDQYLGHIEAAGYTFGDYDVMFTLDSPSTEMDALLFIPIVNTEITALDVNINLYPSSILSFDLNNPTTIGTKSYLGLDETGLNPSEDLTFTYGYADYFEPSNFYTVGSNGENVSVDLGTNTRILGISYTVENSSAFKYKISNAEFIIDGVTSFPLMNPEYLLVNTVNLASTSLIDKNEGLLFFILPSQNSSLSSYGKDKLNIKIIFSNNQEMIVKNALGN